QAALQVVKMEWARSVRLLSTRHGVLSAFFPLRTAKQVRAHFDQARQHFKYRDRTPRRTLASAVSPTIDLVGNARVGTLLNQQFHQLHQDFPLFWILF